MAFTWSAQPAPGVTIDEQQLSELGLHESFASRAEAEAWLGEYYLDLSQAGVASVSLFDDGTLVYGPMSLDE
ncbi:hypothetical protein SAMN05443377_10150 [Propionibacterium cyclohexanicum]|uniref:Uncharacterized protein n=1 Tax=Propionibacterium cyclohexanicum TaxID=64702 RepID=A0A1H9PHW9_9ACTN|nr:hypothetical protein [Propionibacterium cyclohexanicum]SER47727.1 hypothetical protein SAMN05443377_10150 [Propionibacterium cyclohexanicum]